ncbi:MAG TPA: acyl-CoA dehydrogenase, partial [Cyclobacteriaceae bacterium]
EQEILMDLADILIEIYVAESCLLRVEKMIRQKGPESCTVQLEMAMIYLHEAISKIASHGRQAVMAFAEGDELRLMLLGLKRFTRIEPYNLKIGRRKVADYVIDKGKYPF